MKSNLLRALELVFASAPGTVVAILVLTLAQAVLPLASLYCLKLAIDLLAHAYTADHSDIRGRLSLFIALSGGFYLLFLAVRSSATYLNEALILHVTEGTQELVAAKSIRMALCYYEDPVYFDTLHQAQREAPYRLARLVGSFTQVLQSVVAFLAIGGLLIFSLHWSVALSAAATTILAVWLRSRNARHLFQWQRAQTATERQVSYYEWLLASTSNAKEARLFDLGRLFAERTATLRRKLRDQRLEFTRRRLAGDGLSQSAAAIAATAVVGHMTFQALRGALTVGDVVLNYQAFQRGITALQEFGVGIASVYESSLFVSRLFQFFDLPEPVTDSTATTRFPNPLRRGVEFENVSFSYRGSEIKILDGVSFKIESGQMIALIGENGAGKSTLIKLLCGLYEPTEGRITVDGIDLRTFNRQELWSAISVVFQDYGQYCVSAEENIWFGDTSRDIDSTRVRRSAAETGADRVIEGLPNGYEQQLGILVEGGQELSIGQWQKIALARAFYRDTPLIVLDEPSSALDVRAEHAVFEQFKSLTKGRISIVISHRLSTVRMADRIFVLENGRVAEAGSHDELMTSGGTYAELFETQASSYR